MARRDKAGERQTALRRVDALLALARAEALGPDAQLAHRYAALARGVAMRYQASLPARHRGSVCRACDAFLIAGRTARVRLSRGRLVVTCLACGAVRRRPLQAREPA